MKLLQDAAAAALERIGGQVNDMHAVHHRDRFRDLAAAVLNPEKLSIAKTSIWFASARVSR